MKLSTLIPSVLIGAWALTWLQAQNVQSTSADSTATVLEINNETKEQWADTTKYLFSPTYGYAGQLTWVYFADDKTKDASFSSSTRLWWWVKAHITDDVSAYGLWVANFDINPEKSWTAWQGYVSLNAEKLILLLLWWNFPPASSSHRINIWQKATPITLNRPFPVTWAWHFETSTQALIPWGALWAYYQWSGKYINGALGVYKRKGKANFGANLWVEKNGVKVNLWTEYQDQDTYAGALSGSYKYLAHKVSTDLVWKQTPEAVFSWYDIVYALELSDDASVIAYLMQNREGTKTKATEIWALLAGKFNIPSSNIVLDVTAWVWRDFVEKTTNVYVHLYKDLDRNGKIKPWTTTTLLDMLKNKKRTTKK